MGLGIYINGEINVGRLFKGTPPEEKVLKDIEKFFRNHGNDILKKLVWVDRGPMELRIGLHPAEEPIEFSISENGIICSAKTNSAGPGYHGYLVDLLKTCGEKLNIRWDWAKDSDEDGDQTGYYQDRDYQGLQWEMASWLKNMAGFLVKEELKNIKICMPTDYYVEGDYFAMSPLGFWSREWFESVLESSKEGLFEYGSVFFPWWARETDANFYINTAKTLMWIECPWHEPTSEDEIKLYRIICELLEKAYQLDQEMDYPWDEWVELLTLLGETKKAKQIKELASPGKHEFKIGFKRLPMRLKLTGNWNITLPGYFYNDLEDNGETVVYWYKGKTVWGSSLQVQDKEDVPAPAGKLLDDFFAGEKEADFTEVITIDNEALKGKAGISYSEEGYWVLNGDSAVDGSVAIVTICYDDESDRDWAVETWKTVRKEE